jgi:dsDNA-binding SOS-regulon protein
MGRELGRAIVRGEAGAFDKLLAEAKTEYENLKTNNVELDNTKRDELTSRIFAPLDAAFQVIEDAALEGNQSALDALGRSLQIAGLKGFATHSLGLLAAKNDPGALEILLHPEKYGMPLSSTISHLQPAADNGNQTAIDALAAVAKDQKSEPLWYMTANGLAKAAAAGNPVAIDALVNMSSTTNRNLQNAVAGALRGAANQNAKAADALRSMGQSMPPALGQN